MPTCNDIVVHALKKKRHIDWENAKVRETEPHLYVIIEEKIQEASYIQTQVSNNNRY